MQNISKTKKIVNVHSAAVHIENKVSLISRQSWFYLLYKAVPYLDRQNVFSVSLSELKRAIGYKGNNHQHLKQMLEELVTTSIKWNIFDKVDGEIWGVSGLLSHCEIVSGSGMCHYSFSPGLQQRFLNPSMYIKLTF